MSTEGLTADELAQLCQYDTPTICNAIEVFALRPRNAGYMDARIRACFSEMKPVAGYAATATYRADAPARGGDIYSTLDAQVETFSSVPGPPIVVFQDLDDPVVAASFGEVMCTTYKTFGAAGLITSGAARDLDQVRDLGFPAFSNGAICSHGYGHIVDLQGPVHVGGITIYPGDLLHADANGVTTIPTEIAGQLADVCAEYVAAEDVVLNYLKKGNATTGGLSEAREECGGLLEELAQRVSGRA
ncbi:MAG: 4-hydroxy-4-methyl-2-oxoglutarate aldolase [Candidatus Latescibacterota bacterium]|jgi:4-hydroxy-4-methyl-2-oxoglutarate aldolase